MIPSSNLERALLLRLLYYMTSWLIKDQHSEAHIAQGEGMTIFLSEPIIPELETLLQSARDAATGKGASTTVATKTPTLVKINVCYKVFISA